MTTDSPTVTVDHDPDAHRYELLDEGKVIGQAQYLPFEQASGAQRIFFHTVVDDAYSGQGLAGKLAGFALSDTAAAGVTIVPVCPYIRAYLTRHPEHAEDVVEPRPEHLAALRHHH